MKNACYDLKKGKNSMSQIGRRLTKLEAAQNISDNRAPTLDERRAAGKILERYCLLTLIIPLQKKMYGYEYEFTDDDRDFLSRTAEIEHAKDVEMRYRKSCGIPEDTRSLEEIKAAAKKKAAELLRIAEERMKQYNADTDAAT